MQWDDSFKIGIEHIDNQHKGLFSIVNEFENEVEMLELGNDIDLSLYVDLFNKYALTHLGDEEELMEKVHYPDIEEHKIQHLEFIDKCIDFEMACMIRDIDIIKDVLDFMAQWVVDHIVISDAKIGQYITINHLCSLANDSTDP